MTLSSITAPLCQTGRHPLRLVLAGMQLARRCCTPSCTDGRGWWLNWYWLPTYFTTTCYTQCTAWQALQGAPPFASTCLWLCSAFPSSL